MNTTCSHLQAHLDVPAYNHINKIEHITGNIAVSVATKEKAKTIRTMSKDGRRIDLLPLFLDRVLQQGTESRMRII
jgi:hypothetical protein